MKNKENTNKSIANNQKLKERGITLVALVVTIIILLILTGVTLNLALEDNGLFEKARDAVEKYKQAEDEEENAIDKMSDKLEKLTIDYNDYVGCYVEGYEPTKKECIIKSATSGVSAGEKNSNNEVIEGIETNGDQKFKTEEGMKWRIWDYDENTRTIRLISDKPTTAKLTLKGSAGYNNGVWAINEICRQCYGQYDNNGKMKEGIDVANLRRSDIQKVSTYDYTDYKHEYGKWEEFTGDTSETSVSLIYFGETKSYDNTKIPKMWSEFDSQWKYKNDKGIRTGNDKECLIWENEGKYNGNLNETPKEGSKTELKESYYSHAFKNNEFKNYKHYELISKKNSNNNQYFWLSGRYVHLYENKCDFGLQCVTCKSDEFVLNGFTLYIIDR